MTEGWQRERAMSDELGAPKIVDRGTFQAELDALRVREKAHTREEKATPLQPPANGSLDLDGSKCWRTQR